jgi:UDP-glucose 4-epimerase
VLVLDNLSTGRYGNVAPLLGRPEFEFVHGSILNADLMDDAVGRVDTVFHLAAAVGVDLIVRKPLESISTNVRGSEIVLEKAHKYDVRILVASTSEIYGKNTSDRLGEEDDRILGSPLKSRWSYSEAKAIEEILAYTYWRQRGLRSVIVRLFNTVGPRQSGRYGMVLPRFVDQALRGEPLTVYGDGRQTRCFTYVGDVIDALIKLVEHTGAYGKVFNVGGDDEIAIADLAKRVIALTGSASDIVRVPYEQAYEEGFEDMERRVPDLTRVRELIGFAPSKTLDEIIAAVAAELEAHTSP